MSHNNDRQEKPDMAYINDTRAWLIARGVDPQKATLLANPIFHKLEISNQLKKLASELGNEET